MKHNYTKFVAFALLGLATNGYTQTSFDYTGSIQTYTVPANVYAIEIDATGAGGGAGSAPISGTAGAGTQMVGTFNVVPGQELKVLVGQQGGNGTFVGGGGGGTFVWDDATEDLWIAAGGGGGGGATDGASGNESALDASTDENGIDGAGYGAGAGAAGEGGSVPPSATYASGGAGWNSNGSDGTTHGCTSNSTGGQRPLDGGLGGLGGGSGESIAPGGFGGGGGGNARCGAVGGGGGGGYSGGGAGGEIISGEYNAGGGGGSFNAGENQDNTAGIGTANGQVIITEVCKPIEISMVTTDEFLGGDATATVSASGGSETFTYDWDNDGTGDFDDMATITGLTAGTYTVVVKDESICDDITEMVIIDSQVGIAENEMDVEIYPNPTTNWINLTVNGTFIYEVVGLDGGVLLTGTAFNTQKIDLGDFATGTYIINIRAANKTKTVAVVKQ